jgi:hypothetical protein
MPNGVLVGSVAEYEELPPSKISRKSRTKLVSKIDNK